MIHIVILPCSEFVLDFALFWIYESVKVEIFLVLCWIYSVSNFFYNSCINSMYYMGFYCNWVGLEIHEEQLDIATREMTCKTKEPASGHVECT